MELVNIYTAQITIIDYEKPSCFTIKRLASVGADDSVFQLHMNSILSWYLTVI